MKTSTTPLPPLRSVKALEKLHQRIRQLHCSLRTEQTYVHWIRAFIRFLRIRVAASADQADARFADKPTASIPGACNDWAETQAVYRFFDQASEKKRGLDWQTVLAPHVAQAEARMRQHPVVLCLQDTTELDFNGQEIPGLGPLAYEAQRGMYLHPTYVVTPERKPLGVTDAWMWARQAKDADGNRPGIRESLRRTEGHERIAETAQTMPQTRLVHVAVREADRGRHGRASPCRG